MHVTDASRYGDEAAEATHKGMNIAVDAYDVYGAYKSMRTKAMVKAFAKGALKHPHGDQETESGAGYSAMEVSTSAKTDADTAGSSAYESTGAYKTA